MESTLCFGFHSQRTTRIRDVLVIHAEPPSPLQLALDLDLHTFQLDQKLQAEDDHPADADD